MNVFDLAVAEVLETEGLFSNDASDSGGKTRYGITKGVANAHGYNADMRELPKDFAINIYKKAYWDKLRCDDIVRISYPLARELFDSSVNVGVGRVATWLQRSLNVLNNREEFYQDIVVDGGIGERTLRALSSYMKKRRHEGGIVLIRLLNALQGEHYVSLAERREKDERFVYGWALKRL
jgi:lysozyme family protein